MMRCVCVPMGAFAVVNCNLYMGHAHVCKERNVCFHRMYRTIPYSILTNRSRLRFPFLLSNSIYDYESLGAGVFPFCAVLKKNRL